MNYALDALWWKLAARPVRDLASLLTAPPLWQSSCELGVRELLGEHGFRYLLALDADPSPLTDYLARRAPFGHRLGIYAEELLAFWFANAPHAELLAHNLTVSGSDGSTQGAADFVARLNGKPCHIELTCKYYGGTGKPEDMRGLDPKDTLLGKAAKLSAQLALFRTSDGIRTLRRHGLPLDVKPVSIVRGIGFFPQGFNAFEPPLNPYGWRGIYIQDWAEYGFERREARYHLLDRMAYLAPARVAKTETLNETEIRRIDQGLIAVLECRPDGFWHEIERIMKAV
ncbi:TPA: DUF1853 family protein [Neisseria meningitidis]